MLLRKERLMHIAAFQSVSLNEYTGHLSAIVFTQGCDFRCSYCHNPELQRDLGPGEDGYKDLISGDEVLERISKLKGKIEAVTITGGEPLIWIDLEVFMKKVKDMGLLVKLNTNGSSFYRLKRIIDKGLVDYVDMDIKAMPDNYRKVVCSDNIDMDGVKKSVEYLKSSGVDHIFTTVWDEDLLTEMDKEYIIEWVGSSQHEMREKI